MLTVMLNLDGGDPHFGDETSHGASYCPTFLEICLSWCNLTGTGVESSVELARQGARRGKQTELDWVGLG